MAEQRVHTFHGRMLLARDSVPVNASSSMGAADGGGGPVLGQGSGLVVVGIRPVQEGSPEGGYLLQQRMQAWQAWLASRQT